MAATLGVATLETGVDLEGLDKGLDEGKKRTDSAFKNMAKLATGALAGGFLAIGAGLAGIGAAAFDVSGQVQQATKGIQTQLAITADEAETLGGVAQDVWKNNFGENIEDVADSLVTVRQNMDRFGEMAEAELGRSTEKAIALRDAFEIDVGESTNAAAALMEIFGLSSDEAFTFIQTGLEQGLNRSGDFLDSIGEYSVQFAEGGATAAEFWSVMDTGLQSGMLGTDKAADLFKEFRVRIQDGSSSTAEALDAIGLSADEMAAQFASGELTAADAFNQVRMALKQTDDDNLRFQAGVALLGSQFEDLGESVVLGLDPAGVTMEDLNAIAGDLNAQYQTLPAAVEGFKRRALSALTPVGDVLLDMANQALPLVEQGFAFFDEKIVPAIQDVASFLQGFFAELQNGQDPINAIIEAFLNWTNAGENLSDQAFDLVLRLGEIWDGIKEGAAPIIDAIDQFVDWQDVLAALGVVVAAVVLPALVGIVAAAAPVIAVGAALIAGVALLRNAWENDWGGIQEKVRAVIDFIVPKVTAAIAFIKDWWAQHGDEVLAKASAIWESVKTAVFNAVDFIWNDVIQPTVAAISGFWTEHGDSILAKAQAVWEGIQAAVEFAIEQISTVVEAFRAAFSGDWEQFGELLRVAWDNAWQAITDLLAGLWDVIQPILVDLIDNAIEAFENTDWLAVAEGIIDGIVDGISNGINAVADAAENVAEAALDAAMGFLGIGSPSRLFVWIGENIGDGLVEGILSRSRAVEEAVQGLFDVAGHVSGIGGTIASIFKRRTVDPLEQRLKDLNKAIPELSENISEAFELDVDFASLSQEERIRFYFRAIHAGNQALANDIMELGRLETRRMQTAEEFAEQQEKLLNIQKQQEDLALLQAQRDLLALIEENNLSTSILTGLEFGIDADLGAILQATSSAMQQIIAQAESELGIGSPSKVFQKIARNVTDTMADTLEAGRDRIGRAVRTLPLIDASTRPGALQPAAAAAPAGGDTYHFDFRGAYIDSEAKIERAVKKAMDERGREADRRVRTR